MPTLTTHSADAGRNAMAVMPTPPALHLAFDLGNATWLVASSPGIGAPPRVRRLPARDLPGHRTEREAARHHFALGPTHLLP
jgi:hypothetical protein